MISNVPYKYKGHSAHFNISEQAMASTYASSSQDGFVSFSDGTVKVGLNTVTVSSTTFDAEKHAQTPQIYDAIIIGAGFAGLVAARELSHRHLRVLLIEARDRIGGRAMASQFDGLTYEMGGTWIHWSQPHVWTEMTRYGLTMSETKGTWPDQVHVLVDQCKRLKIIPMAQLWPKICEIMNKYHNVDGLHGRTVLPLPHTPLAALDQLKTFDQLSMKDRLDQVFADLNDDEMKEIMDAYIIQNSQCGAADGGFIDHLRWWALGDFDSERLYDKTSRFKIAKGTSALAQAILNDCQNLELLLSTPIRSIDRTNPDQVIVHGEHGQSFVSRTVICTVPLNVVDQIEFQPPLQEEKQRVVNEGQCGGGIKFSVKLEKPVGCWYCLAPYPNPISQGFSDDAEGSILILFGPDGLLDIRDINAVERELAKFIPDVKVKYVIGHDWRNDPFVKGTWSWFRPGQVSSNMEALQRHESPVFFASSDISNGWRGFIDGAFDSGLATVRQVLDYLRTQEHQD